MEEQSCRQRLPHQTRLSEEQVKEINIVLVLVLVHDAEMPCNPSSGAAHLQVIHDVMIDRQSALKHQAEVLLDFTQPALECSQPACHMTDL